jgi:hypothetical protein
MFDPTIYDNLKVVFEGGLYDLDEAGRILVIGREDLVDLASMSRTFRMQVRKRNGRCKASLELFSGLLDFAGEFQYIRLADESPGCHLRLSFELPFECGRHSDNMQQHLESVWGEVAQIFHEETRVLLPEEGGGHYKIRLEFLDKIDESHIDDVEPLLEHFVATLDELEGYSDSL